MTRAKQLFDEITSASFPPDIIGRMISDKRPETEYLEFKGGKINPKEAKKYWSKALSGFGNSEGGVLIWGVEARKTASLDDPAVQIDAACDKQYIENPIEFAEMLRRLLRDAVLDPIPGISSVPYRCGDEGGFVVSYIPAGPHPPYRAALDDSRNYFQRVDDSFVVLSHSMLRSLFFPKNSANIYVEVTVKGEIEHLSELKHGNRPAIIRGSITLHNSGNGTGRNVVARISAQDRSWAIDRTGTNIVERKRVRTDEENYSILASEYDIHPGDSLEICRFTWEGTAERRFEEGGVSFAWEIPIRSIVLNALVFCADQPAQSIKIQFGANQIDGGAKGCFYGADDT